VDPFSGIGQQKNAMAESSNAAATGQQRNEAHFLLTRQDPLSSIDSAREKSVCVPCPDRQSSMSRSTKDRA